MRSDLKRQFFAYALEQMPREACALLILHQGKQELRFCRNISELNAQFVLHPADYLKAKSEGAILAVLHSHVFLPSTPSEADRVGCEQTGLPWYILSVPTGAWTAFGPTGYVAPLIGREFSHGILDCYSLIRDYYRQTLGIHLPDFPRDFEWWEKGQNLYLDNFAKAGFRAVPMSDLRAHDVLLMQLYSDVVNHGAVYLGDDTMLHHLNNRLSSREVFGGYYKRHCVKVLRHEDHKAAR